MRYQRLNSLVALIVFAIYGSDTGQCAEKKGQSTTQQKRLKINPMTDVDGAWVANLETDVYRAGTFENLTLGYSANNGWDFSISLLNTQVLGSHIQFYGYTFINVAKEFAVTEDYSLIAGTQNGLALVNVQPKEWLNFNFLDNRYQMTPWLLIHGGPYLANKANTGTSLQAGFLAGTELTFIPDQLSLELDYLSGHHALSGATATLLYNLTTHCQFYLGVLVPEQNSGNEFAGILGFNFSTHRL